jgi:diaminopimelate decarboxylase
LGNGDAHKAAARARSSKSVNFVGVHCHIGSNVFAVENFAHAAKIMVDLANELEVEQLTFGGGLGVAYVETEHASTITEWSTHLFSAAEQLRKPTQVFVEPGRSIVAAAAVTVYEVGTVKPIPGVRTYVAVDGGMSDNPRPVMYGSGYELFMPANANADRTESIRLVGKHCESGDILISETLAPAGLRVGDLVATPVTGAYGHSMGSNYNKITRPPVVFARNGKARLVVRRETYDDLVRLDVSE